jgi:EmrB/QacA subfamily drug resistance transporter
MQPTQDSKSSSIEGSNTHTTPLKSIQQGRTQAIVLGAMSVAIFMTNCDSTIVETALPQFQASLGADMLGLQWILNAYNLPVVSLLLTSGTIGDRYGRKRVFLAGMILFILASILCGFSPNLKILLAGRTLQGMGAAVLIPLSLTILTRMFPDPRERAKAIGIWSAISTLALVAAPVLGGLLVDRLGWQSLFFLNVPLGLLAFKMTIDSVEEQINLEKPKLDWLGLLVSIILLASFTGLLTETSTGDWLSSHVLGLLGVTSVSALVFWVVESRSHHPMFPLQLFKNSTFTLANTIPVLVFFASNSLIFIFGLFLQQVQEHSVARTGAIFFPMNSAIILASFVSGWTAARLGWRFPCLSGLTLASVSIFSLLHIDVDTDSKTLLWNLILSGFGGGLTIPPLATAAMNAVLPIQEGIASAIFNTGIYLGSILGISVQGTVLSRAFTSELQRSLTRWNLPTDLQNRITAEALHNLAKVPSDLPSTLSPLVLHQAMKQAFVSGLHATLIVSGLTLIVGAGLILMVMPSKLKTRSHA